MGLFSFYDRPGPGVREDEPRKTGLPRIWEMISRDYIDFWLAGLINVLCLFPFAWLIGYACATHSILFAIIAGAVGGMIASPSFYGLADTLLLSLRDEPDFWWHRYSRVVRKAWKSTLLPGMILGTIFAIQFFILMHMNQVGGMGMFLCQIVSMMVSTAFLVWGLLQHVLLDMGFGAMVKNIILLSIRYIIKTAMACAVMLAYGLLVLMIFPNSVFLLLVAGLWLPLLIVFQILYPTMDEVFEIEERLAERKEQNY